MAADSQFELLKGQLIDPRWRLNNLYKIMDKEGRRIQFRLNWAQENLLNNLHFCNTILKARQLGFSTFIQIFMLDQVLFNANIRCGTIAHRLDDARTLFRDKIKFPYDNLPEALRNARSLISDSAEELVLSNNSSIRVGTSLRSGTLQYLHVSEYGKMCAQFSDKAREVRTGALNTLQAGQVVFIESTAEGQEGHFHELCETGQAKQRMGTKLTPLDFKFFFYPWFEEPSYELDPAGVVIPEDLRRYFDKLESGGIVLNARKKAWYSKKIETQLSDMKREYPSTPQEAFEASIEGAYYAEEMAKAELQGRVGAFTADPALPVNTAWDLGVGDATAIWFWQKNQNKILLCGYYENSGEGLPHYVSVLKDYQKRHGWQYGEHILPQDARVRELGTGRTRVEQFITLTGTKPTICPPHSLEDGINAVRATLPHCWFAEDECSTGIRHAKAYRKDWDETRGCWKDKPRHDASSHGCDALRYMSLAWREVSAEAVADPTPKQIVQKMVEAQRSRTMNDLWDEHVAKQIELGADPEEFGDFALSDNTLNME